MKSPAKSAKRHLHFDPDEIVLVEAPPKKLLHAPLLLADYFSGKRRKIILVSATRSCKSIFESVEKKSVAANIYLVDCICLSQGIRQPDSIHVHHVEGVGALTNIMIAINEYAKKLDRPVIIFDSVNALLVRNDEKVVARFLHSIMTRLRIMQLGGFFLSAKAEMSKELRAEITQLCDKVAYL